MSIGNTGGSFGSPDIAESEEQRARQKALREIDPHALDRYDLHPADILPPKVIEFHHEPPAMTRMIIANRYELIQGCEEQDGMILILDREHGRLIGHTDEASRAYVAEMIRLANRLETH